MMWISAAVLAAILVVIGYDVLQRRHAILRNFPLLGHLRYLFEHIGPELRQYIVTDNDEERPFSRDQRRWVYASAKKENNYFGFGTDNDLEGSANYLIIKPRLLSSHSPREGEAEQGYPLPSAKVLGAARGRPGAFRPGSVVNVSAMSFGSLGPTAIEALNRGSQLAGCLHNTGEGGVSDHHRCGGDLVWQIGTGYFGCRDEQGRFDLDTFKEVVAANPVRAIEIKLSQGAKAGLGGLLPKEKITKEISRIRGVPQGVDCVSPPHHSAFSSVDEMLDFVELLAGEVGLPVGIKSAVGELDSWAEMAELMTRDERGVDFITIDGSEGGTGAAPLVFADHVALPFKMAMARVYSEFARRDLHKDVVFVGAGRLGLPERALFGFCLGCDLINVAREAMLSIGCIQAQRCHTGRCPTGVATQNRWLVRGLDPAVKSVRLANYIAALRKELLQLSRACGVAHPALVTTDDLEILDGEYGSRSPRELFGYHEDWSRPREQDRRAIESLMAGPVADL